MGYSRIVKLIGASIYSFTDHLFKDLQSLGLDISKGQISPRDGEIHHLLNNNQGEYLDYISVEQDDEFRSHHSKEGEFAICPRLFVDSESSINWISKVNLQISAAKDTANFNISGAWIYLDAYELEALCADLKLAKSTQLKLSAQQNLWIATPDDSHFKTFALKKKYPFWGLVIEAPQIETKDLPKIKIAGHDFAWVAQNSIGWDILLPLIPGI